MTNLSEPIVSRRLVLNERPNGEPDGNTFRMETMEMPQPANGEILVRNHYLSLDPYMRGRLSDRRSYATPVAIGETMVGGTVSQVVRSANSAFKQGDWLVALGGWQDYALLDGQFAFPLDKQMEHKSLALGALGMPGFTAWAGLMEIGKPKAGETLVVAAATGPVGSMVGQLAKLHGLKVVGIAGGAEKCRYAVEHFGFDACIDHRADDFAEQLKKAVPDGIDIYFENVGGKVFRAVLPLLNTAARIPLCGTISNYNNPDQAVEGEKDRTDLVMAMFLQRRITVRGFIINQDFSHLHADFMKSVEPLVKSGKIRYREDMSDGLENAPKALNEVLNGKNFGKKVIRIAAEE